MYYATQPEYLGPHLTNEDGTFVTRILYFCVGDKVCILCHVFFCNHQSKFKYGGGIGSAFKTEKNQKCRVGLVRLIKLIIQYGFAVNVFKLYVVTFLVHN